jgi:hypothetical protein
MSVGNKSHNNNKRRVSFVALAHVNEIPARSAYSNLEKQMTWYDSSEIQNIKCNNKKTISHYRQHSRILQETNVNAMPATTGEDEHYCLRGLELFTREGSKERKDCRDKSRDAVLKENTLQAFEGISDPNYLSYIYRKQTKTARKQALVRGLEDAACAAMVYFEEEEDEEDNNDGSEQEKEILMTMTGPDHRRTDFRTAIAIRAGVHQLRRLVSKAA